MTKDATYEQAVSVLERRWADRITRLAADAVSKEEDDVYAADAVASILLNSPEWEKVEAVDISDIAYDACIEARRAG